MKVEKYCPSDVSLKIACQEILDLCYRDNPDNVVVQWILDSTVISHAKSIASQLSCKHKARLYMQDFLENNIRAILSAITDIDETFDEFNDKNDLNE
jgi:hypothetical protein